jgi:site-specific recombinase XerD
MVKQYQTFEELTDTAAAYLTSLRYSLPMVYYYQREWRYVGNYMKERGIREYTSDVGLRYLTETVGETEMKYLPQNKRVRIRSVSSLSDFVTTGSIRKRKLGTPPEELDGQIGLAISRYIIDISQLNGYAKSTIQCHKLYLSRFLKYLNKHNIKSFDSFNPKLMVNFAGYLKEYSVITRHLIILKTNQFLKYLYENGTLPIDYSAIAPKDKYVRQAKLPSYFSPDEVNRLLDSIDRSNAFGKRDYAMILLVVRFGLRCSDVATMKFCNLQWEQEKIVLNQKKTKIPIELPLFQDIGNAIIDYLKYGRPQSDLPYIFLRLIPPYDNMDENALYGSMQKYLRLSGIKYDERRHGPHALRHSLATNLLKQNTPLPVISSVLGHINTESTIGYLRVNTESLRKCALEVPRMTITGKEVSQ